MARMIEHRELCLFSSFHVAKSIIIPPIVRARPMAPHVGGITPASGDNLFLNLIRSRPRVRSMAPGTSRRGAPIISMISGAERQRSPDGAPCAPQPATPFGAPFISAWACLFLRISLRVNTIIRMIQYRAWIAIKARYASVAARACRLGMKMTVATNIAMISAFNAPPRSYISKRVISLTFMDFLSPRIPP